MFKLQPKPTFEAAVEIVVPGGKTESVTFLFKHMGKAAFRALFEGLGSEDSEVKTDTEVLSQIVNGWKGVDAEFTEENFALLLDNYPTAAMAILARYQSGLFEAKVKN